MSTELDVNNVFEELLMSENLAATNNYEEGYKVGKNNLMQGYHLGYHKTSVIAAQLGFFKGELMKSHTQSELLKAGLQKENLLSSIDNFPDHNSSSTEILKSFENIKLNFNKYCSITKNSLTSFEKDKLNF